MSLQKHYTVQQIAEAWQVDEQTVRRIFQDRPGVLKLTKGRLRGKRMYVTLRIPESVLQAYVEDKSR